MEGSGVFLAFKNRSIRPYIIKIIHANHCLIMQPMNYSDSKLRPLLFIPIEQEVRLGYFCPKKCTMHISRESTPPEDTITRYGMINRLLLGPRAIRATVRDLFEWDWPLLEWGMNFWFSTPPPLPFPAPERDFLRKNQTFLVVYFAGNSSFVISPWFLFSSSRA